MFFSNITCWSEFFQGTLLVVAAAEQLCVSLPFYLCTSDQFSDSRLFAWRLDANANCIRCPQWRWRWSSILVPMAVRAAVNLGFRPRGSMTDPNHGRIKARLLKGAKTLFSLPNWNPIALNATQFWTKLGGGPQGLIWLWVWVSPKKPVPWLLCNICAWRERLLSGRVKDRTDWVTEISRTRRGSSPVPRVHCNQ